MRIIKKTRLDQWAREHPRAAAGLTRWYRLTRSAQWMSIQDVRKVFPHADPVTVASGNTVVVFNVAGNDYRLIAAIHYDKARVFLLRLLSHADYDKDRWKDEL